ncbi:hypothetical protein HAX54_019654 [Datura stramonium]|uniref:Uncharacterized protein n=1 Tax=Datura stramonium TaxID=4076 RepID=A0ABS8URY0_DATST|nr:hypothetical protein [Datura stramonium]
MPPKSQPRIGGSKRRTDKTETTHHLRDENTDSKEESDEGDDSLENGSSSNGPGSDSVEESDNEVTSSSTRESEPLRGDVLKAKMRGFRDSLHSKFKRADKYFWEGLTTTARGHLKRSIAEEVRIIDLKLEAHVPILAEIDVETPSTKRSITVALKPYVSLDARIDDMVAWVNERLKDLTVPDLAKFAAKLKKAQDEIAKLQQERQN